jgi:superfamily II DNA or RNA helicase
MVRLRGALIIEKEKVVPEIINKLKQLLSFLNPFDKVTVFRAYKESSKYLVVPRGSSEIAKILEDSPIVPELTDSSAEISTVLGYDLREYQTNSMSEIVSYLTAKEYGEVLLTAKTGSGKSYSIAWVIAQIKQKTLIVSHLTMLNEQMCDEMSSNLNASVRVLTSKDSSRDLPDISIASFALLDSNPELLKSLRSHIGLLIVDELENMITSTRLEVIFKLSYKFGIFMSATPTKELMQHTPAIHYVAGSKIITMTPDPRYCITVDMVMLDYRHLSWVAPPMHLRKKSLNAFYKNNKIISDVVKLCKVLSEKQGVIWIIADYKKLQDALKNQLESIGISSEIIRAETTKTKRKLVVKRVKSQDIDVIIGSAPFSAGLSFPTLQYGIRLMPHSSSEELLQQQLGRLERYADFKEHTNPIWFDFYFNGDLESSSYYRQQYYNRREGQLKLLKLSEILDGSILK